MMNRGRHFYIRRVHRWLSVFVGIQLLLWTIGGVYFSWTDIDEVRGEQFVSPAPQTTPLSVLMLPDSEMQISELALRFIDERPFLWVNDNTLLDPESGEVKLGVSREEAVRIAQRHVNSTYDVAQVSLLTSVGMHHEYRGRPLPVWAITFEGPEDLTAYVAQRDGSFQRVRHNAWRLFDFFWMLHTMDYQGRDDFNNGMIRAFSLLALLVVVSGFILFYSSRRKRI